MGFLTECLKKPRIIGSVTPSSRFLAAKMLKPIDFSSARKIVELGAGTGVFTRRILRRMRPQSSLFVFEINPQFAGQLRMIKDKRMKLLTSSAAQLTKHVRDADVIVSSLPFAMFSERSVRRIINEVKRALKPGGMFVQYQYSLKSYNLLKQHFAEVSLDFTPLNILPAFVYLCRK